LFTKKKNSKYKELFMEKEKNTISSEENKPLNEEQENLETESREEQVVRRIHELDIILEELEDQLYNQKIAALEETEYKNYKKESNQLRKELKEIRKTNKKEGTLESLPIWIPIYALIICILGAYPIVPMLPLNLIKSIFPSLPVSLQTNFMFYLLMIGYSLLLILISFFIWLYAFKNKAIKKMFLYAMFIQLFIAIISCLVAYL